VVYDQLQSGSAAIDSQRLNVYLYDDWLVLSRRVIPGNNPINVKPIISEAPVLQEDNYAIAPIEKILVDLLADHELYHAYQEETEYIFREALTRFTVNRDKLRRYARRRNRFQQVQTILDHIDGLTSNEPSR
jgi:hypothetical protein